MSTTDGQPVQGEESFDTTLRLWDVRDRGPARAHGLPVTGVLAGSCC